MLTLATAEGEDDDTYCRLLDVVGVGLPIRELEPLHLGAGGLLGSAAAGDGAVFDRLADRLARDGWVLADLGTEPGHGVWAAACAEGRSLLPHMKAGILEAADGTVTAGKSPSGAPRGDVYITVSEAQNRRPGGWPALGLLDTALAVVGHALAPALERHPALRMRTRIRTDPFFKCFPGGAAEYGAHFDGGRIGAATKLTAVLYCNEEWRAEDGGRLHILDERGGCWRCVTPLAGRLILFLVEGCLHKVEPCHATRFALTNWWMEPTHRPGPGQTGISATVRAAYERGDPRRYERHEEGARCEVVRGLAAIAK